jgi:hypothetical protein
LFLIAVVTVAGIVVHMAHASGESGRDFSPIYGIKIPAGYRDWLLIAEKHLHFAGNGSKAVSSGVQCSPNLDRGNIP